MNRECLWKKTQIEKKSGLAPATYDFGSNVSDSNVSYIKIMQLPTVSKKAETSFNAVWIGRKRVARLQILFCFLFLSFLTSTDHPRVRIRH